MKKVLVAGVTLTTFVGCGAESGSSVNVSDIESSGSVSIRAYTLSDNWFAIYWGEELILEDSVPITTERSFNAESFTFDADFPLQLNFILKDFKENDTGLEYIGARNQQMGGGGFIAQFFDANSNELIGYSNDGWKCLVIHEAPLDKSCEDLEGPLAGEGASAIDPKGGYDQIRWDSSAELIWSNDLETDNTLLCRTILQ